MRKKYLLIPIVIFIFLNAIAIIYAKNNFHHFTQENATELNYTPTPNDGIEYPLFTEFKNLDDIIEKSDLVLSVKLINKEFYQEDVLSNVKVVKTLKGKTNSDNVSIAEPLKVTNFNPTMHAQGGYVPLQMNTEYFVFLQNTARKNTYKYTSIEFGHFNTKEETNILEYDTVSLLKVNDLVGYDFVYIYKQLDNAIELRPENGKSMVIKTEELNTKFIEMKRECFIKYGLQ